MKHSKTKKINPTPNNNNNNNNRISQRVRNTRETSKTDLTNANYSRDDEVFRQIGVTFLAEKTQLPFEELITLEKSTLDLLSEYSSEVKSFVIDADLSVKQIKTMGDVLLKQILISIDDVICCIYAGISLDDILSVEKSIRDKLIENAFPIMLLLVDTDQEYADIATAKGVVKLMQDHKHISLEMLKPLTAKQLNVVLANPLSEGATAILFPPAPKPFIYKIREKKVKQQQPKTDELSTPTFFKPSDTKDNDSYVPPKYPFVFN